MRIVLAALIAGALQLGLWLTTHDRAALPDAPSISSFSFTPFASDQDGEDAVLAPRERIEADLAAVAPVTRTIRTYSVDKGLDVIPELAAKHGLNVSLGVWIGPHAAHNRAEIEKALEVARAQRNVRAIIVGNEVLLRRELTPEQLGALAREVKRRSDVPVTVAETWNVWMDNPKLANSVDFISAHVLPYWEGIPAERAAEYALQRYADLKRAFPGKKVVIAEFGWPSGGANFHGAHPGADAQAAVIRTFAAEAAKRGIEYNIVEAIDQPWKTMEGKVGAYWGLFDADRAPKFPLTGPLDDGRWHLHAALSLALGLAVAVAGLVRRRPTFGHALAYALAANALGFGLATAALWPFANYWNPGTLFAWGLGLCLVLPLMAMTLGKIHEIAAVVLGRRPARSAEAVARTAPSGYAPKVSIHIPAYKEKPEMLIATLDSVAALDYPDFECLVVLNNTPEPEYWEPVSAHCERLGARFKFLNLLGVKGFKAGAMNAALPHMAADAEIIAVLDADYVVAPNWLKDLVPAFHDPKVALVQAPQDHRDGGESAFKACMNAEYAGFFDIGMVQRNEADAIVAHGTMLMVRRSAFEAVGGWATDTIVEDTELGLRLYQAGWSALYTNARYGWGMLPDTFAAFKTQRNRWAYGAVQIIRKHWRALLPWTPGLTGSQKREFAVGWTIWLSDAFGVLAALMNLAFVPFLIWTRVAVPEAALTVPILTAFAVNVAHGVVLYRARVRTGWAGVLGAAVAAMSLQVAVASAVLHACVKDSLPFKRTEKGGAARKAAGRSPILVEMTLGTALSASAVWIFRHNWNDVVALNLFAATMAAQSLPFLCAVVMRLLERGAGLPPGAPRTLPAHDARPAPGVGGAPAPIA